MSVLSFKVLLIAFWLFTLIAAATAFNLEPTLPQVLREYVAQEAEAPTTNTQFFALIVGGIAILSNFVSYIGLFFWKRWSRSLFVASGVTTYGVSLLSTLP